MGCHVALSLHHEKLCLEHNAKISEEDSSDFQVALQDQSCSKSEWFVVRGFSQKGLDYEETFNPLSKYTTIRVFMSLVSFMGWIIHKMRVKTTLFNGIINDEVFIEHS